MTTLESPIRSPLAHRTDAEIDHLLRGFSPAAIAAAKALRSEDSAANLDACLFGIMMFYLPSGTPPPASMPSGEARLREDLGLDSLSMAEAMYMVEELFAIQLENRDIAEAATIADARALIAAKLDPEAAAPSDE